MPHALIIDDDPFSAEILERMLAAEDIPSTTVFEATQVTTCIDSRVSLVFLDLEMPKMNGYEVLKLLRQTLNTDVPIVACTAHANEAGVAWEMGFHSFLSKPVSQDRFPSQLASILKNESVWDI